MTPKEYLSQIKILDNQIKNLDEEIAAMRGEIITIRSSWPDGMPRGSDTSDPVGELATRLADELERMEREQLELRSKLWSKRNEVIHTINKVRHAECNRLLYLRYVQLETWEAIAVDMHYTYQWVAGPLHSTALYEVKLILENT